jgi:hypothetical protein
VERGKGELNYLSFSLFQRLIYFIYMPFSPFTFFKDIKEGRKGGWMNGWMDFSFSFGPLYFGGMLNIF